jgi:hypothetical protein
MSYQWHWHDQKSKTILVFNMTGRWTWDEALQAAQIRGVLLGTVNHTVHTLYLFDHSANWIPQGSAFSNLRSLMRVVYPNEGLTVFVGRNLLIEMFIRAVSNVYQMASPLDRYRFVCTEGDALSTIKAHRTGMVPKSSALH